MKPNELIVGGYYVREERRLILHFYCAESEGQARFHAYNQQDGAYKDSSHCAIATLKIWTDRKATVEEISRLHRDELEVSISAQTGGMFERRPRPLRQALRATRG